LAAEQLAQLKLEQKDMRVIIVGAGPAGLISALNLIQERIPCTRLAGFPKLKAGEFMR